MTSHRPEIAPEAWEPAHRIAKRVFRPVERFLHIEAASGIVLLAAAVIGLIWANSPWAHAYEALWHTPISFGIGSFVFERSLHFWINEGLMAVFFLVVGLEIRREMHEGELSDLRKATLPIAAAIGGMIVPAILYVALNPSGAARSGWGVPMATDIAFAVGVLALLGKRVPAALRVLLLALAIIDDIGAILVIAVFYSSGIAWSGLLLTTAGVLGVALFQVSGVRSALAYIVPGAVVWAGLLQAGVHPTISGVILGLLTPARAWFGQAGFVAATREAVEQFEHAALEEGDVHELIRPLRFIRQAHREALPPAVRVQAQLHTWVAFGIMPLFALANAGVNLQGFDASSTGATTVLFGVLAGLVIGKPVGILLATFATVKLGLCKLPRGMTYGGVAIVGLVAGIGFTMAIFIAGLAFSDPVLLAAAKLAVLLASAVAAIFGFVAGRLLLAPEPIPGAALSADEAEASTDR